LFLDNAPAELKRKLTVADMEDVILLMENAYYTGMDSLSDDQTNPIKGFVMESDT
jgi:hypothetical protein